MRALFVCRQNRCRSRVAEDIFRVLTWDVDGRSHHDARSAGTKAHPRGRQITTEDTEWADVICVMEQEQEGYIRQRWPAQADKIRVLGIPDIYQPSDEKLQVLLMDVVRTLLADGPPARKAIDAAPPREHRLPPSGFRWWNGVLAGRSVGVLAALVAVVAIVGYLYQADPEHPGSIRRSSNGPGPSAAPAVIGDAGSPARPDLPSDQTAPVVPVPNKLIGPTRPAGPVDLPVPAGESLKTRSGEIGLWPPRPPIAVPPERPRAPVALPPPVPLTTARGEVRDRPASTAESPRALAEVGGVRPAPGGGRPRDGESREDADGTDPAAIIDWVLREYPARR
jgi:predicted protein tyrosine phosphatase